MDRTRLEHTHECESVYTRHHPIDDEEIIPLASYHVERHLSIRCYRCLISLRLQVERYILSDLGIVIDDEYMHMREIEYRDIVDNSIEVAR